MWCTHIGYKITQIFLACINDWPLCLLAPPMWEHTQGGGIGGRRRRRQPGGGGPACTGDRRSGVCSACFTAPSIRSDQRGPAACSHVRPVLSLGSSPACPTTPARGDRCCDRSDLPGELLRRPGPCPPPLRSLRSAAWAGSAVRRVTSKPSGLRSSSRLGHRRAASRRPTATCCKGASSSCSPWKVGLAAAPCHPRRRLCRCVLPLLQAAAAE